jgi:hypothetical protein
MRALEQHAASHGQDLSQSVAGLLRTALERADAAVGLPRPVIRGNPKTGLPYLESVHAAWDDSPQRVAEILLDQDVNWYHEARDTNIWLALSLSKHSFHTAAEAWVRCTHEQRGS